MKPSDFQKTVQCRFESCLKKVVRHVVKDYQQKLKRRQEKETLFCSLYSFGVTGNEHIHKAKRQTPHESMLPSWCDSQERLIDRKRIDTSKTVSQIVIACQTIKEPVLTGVINVWPVI